MSPPFPPSPPSGPPAAIYFSLLKDTAPFPPFPAKAKKEAEKTMEKVKKAMRLDYFNK